MTNRGGIRGQRRKKWRIHVTSIKPDKYPTYQRDPDNPFSTMETKARLHEIETFCARLWARTCQEAARTSAGSAKVAA